MQDALKLRYPERGRGEASDPDALPEPEGESTSERLVFVLLEQRWGAEGPVPWVEVAVPGIERFTGPVALYRTELSTGEFEYPWVSTLVVARVMDSELELSIVLSPSFSGDAESLAALVTGTCVPSEAMQIELTRAVATLYALGDSSRVTGGSRDGSCKVAEFHLYEDVWRIVAVDFDDSGVVRHVHAFNPQDSDDSTLRARVCHGKRSGDMSLGDSLSGEVAAERRRAGADITL